MGQFIVSRANNGVSFYLLAENGRRLATSRTYATLDACKKGIASLIVNAPDVPLVDSSAGEYGPNPKFEVVEACEGYGFLLKSANGKSVITSPTYATKKACLRAVSMLRKGVLDADVQFLQKQGLVPLTMTAHMAAVGAATTQKKAPLVSGFPLSEEEAVVMPITDTCDEPFTDTEADEVHPVSEVPPVTPTPTTATASVPKVRRVSPTTGAARGGPVPRVIRLQPSVAVKQKTPGKTAPFAKKASTAPKKSPRTLLDFLLKRK